MPTITIETRIAAPIEAVFDLARDVGAHAASSAFTGERVVAPGRTEGLLELGDLLTFEGRHLGVRQRITVRITEMDPPRRYVDEGVRTALRGLHHLHEFWEDGVPHPVPLPASGERVAEGRVRGTVMRDVVTWRSPLGILGRIADALFVTRHMRWFVTEKQRRLKAMIEDRDSYIVS
ncbi:MAG TPA: SRPBCC family protein [Thermoanaerobaculia bacterium]